MIGTPSDGWKGPQHILGYSIPFRHKVLVTFDMKEGLEAALWGVPGRKRRTTGPRTSHTGGSVGEKAYEYEADLHI